LRANKPAGRKFLAAVGQVLPAEHAQLQHLLRGQLRTELQREVSPDRLGAVVHVSVRAPVVYHDPAFRRALIEVWRVITSRSVSKPLARAAARAASRRAGSSVRERASIQR